GWACSTAATMLVRAGHASSVTPSEAVQVREAGLAWNATMPAVQKADGIHQEDSMARVVRFHETGGPEVLKIEELDVPPPGKGEVQIGVKALGLNRAESMIRRGQYVEQPKLPGRGGLGGGGVGARSGGGRAGLQGGGRRQHHPGFQPDQVRGLWRSSERPGPRRGAPPRLALLGAGGVDLDAVPDRLRRAD